MGSTAVPIEVSAIIPTYNRRELVQRAIDSVLAQTHPVDEIIVIDDGSTDGTGDALRARYGERIRYHWQDNAGVSAARNAGMAIARGRYFALLDSDDAWRAEKTAHQVAWLDARPDFGMVLCDVVRVDADHKPYDVFHRREVLPEDGWVLHRLLLNPSLVPASTMFRREVFDTCGGFDPSLRTAEDLDFHLRVARRWQIGVIEAELVEAMRGHQDGLSGEATTYDDYVKVVERAVADAEGLVDDSVRREAMALTYLRNARGMLLRRRWRDARRLWLAGWRLAPDAATRGNALAMLPFAAKRMLNVMLGRG
ncbi:MAG: glycosyltransferase [Lysobacter sp.]|nr:glycosyltransferase [Lysobacter sp.]